MNDEARKPQRYEEDGVTEPDSEETVASASAGPGSLEDEDPTPGDTDPPIIIQGGTP
jgi:hypothetical protein